MTNLLEYLWNFEARLFPVITGLAVFGLLHLIRRLTAIEYTPSYFAIFPASLLNHQLSEYFGEYYGEDYSNNSKDKSQTHRLFFKSLISFFLTFFLVPLIIGFITAFFLNQREFAAFLILIVLWEAWHCIKAIYDFSSYRGDWRTTVKFFGSFYLFYLLFLFFVLRLGYNFTQPFVEKQNISGLLSVLESFIVPIIINVFIIGVLSNLFAHWLINKDAIKPDFDENDGEKYSE